LRRTQRNPGHGLGHAYGAARAIAAQASGSRLRRALILLGLVLLIVHCRPWSYTLFADAREWHGRSHDAR
jgi:hypothetical protein